MMAESSPKLLIITLAISAFGCIKSPAPNKNINRLDSGKESIADKNIGSEIKAAFGLYSQERNLENFQDEKVAMMDEVADIIDDQSDDQIDSYFNEQIVTDPDAKKDIQIFEKAEHAYIAGATIIAAGAIGFAASIHNYRKANGIQIDYSARRVQKRIGILSSRKALEEIVPMFKYWDEKDSGRFNVFKDEDLRIEDLHARKLDNGLYSYSYYRGPNNPEIKRLENTKKSYKTRGRVLLGTGVLAVIGGMGAIWSGLNKHDSAELKLSESKGNSKALKNLQKRLTKIYHTYFSE